MHHNTVATHDAPCLVMPVATFIRSLFIYVFNEEPKTVRTFVCDLSHVQYVAYV